MRRSIPSHHCTSHRPSHLPSCAEAAASQVVSKVEVPGPSILGFFMPRSSSSGMPRGSNGAPMVDVKEQVSFSLDGLAVAWDNDPLIRERLRSDGGHLLKTYDAKLKQAVDGQIEIKVENLRVNACILSPLFKMMSQNERASPCVEKLQLQVADLFNRAKVVYTKHGDRVYQDSWAIKRLCTLGKSQQFHGSPPKENIKTKNVLLYITYIHRTSVSTYSPLSCRTQLWWVWCETLASRRRTWMGHRSGTQGKDTWDIPIQFAFRSFRGCYMG